MTTALVISTYNSPEALNIIIDAISKQFKIPNEIIIAEDGNDSKTLKIVNFWKNKISSKFIHIQQKDSGFRKALILNKAIKSSHSDYIIQIDGDCIPDEYFIYDHLANAKKGCYLYGTRVHIKKNYISEVLWCLEHKNQKLIFSFFSPKIKKRFRKVRLPFLSIFYKKKHKISHKFRGCNTSFWRQDFIAVNGYDNDFIGWGREDSDLMIRMHNNGVMCKRLKFVGVVYHLDHDQKDETGFLKNNLIQTDSVLNKRIKALNGLFESTHEI